MSNNNRHSILVVADAFGKPAYTPRLRYLCYYLVKQGWQVDVYTEQLEPLTFQHDYSITEIPIYRNRTWDWFIKSIGAVLFDWKSRYFAKQVEARTAGKRYDIVFACTFLPTPLRAALKIAQAQHIPLHIDLRDIDEQTATNQYRAHSRWHSRMLHQWYRTINICRRNAILQQTSSVSSVSPWHVRHLSQWNKHITLIYNGFDEQAFQPLDTSSKQFVITYTGRIYDAALQDPVPFFEALRQMRIEGHLPHELVVKWYTDENSSQRMMKWAQHTHTTDLMQVHPFVPTTEIPSLLHESSLVLVVSKKANENGPHGIMTTKFFEALGVEKPVLCVPSDEECLAQVIEQTNAGIAATTVEEIQTFILDKYAEWKANGFTRQAVNQEQKKLFTRQYQAQQFEQIFFNVIHE